MILFLFYCIQHGKINIHNMNHNKCFTYVSYLIKVHRHEYLTSKSLCIVCIKKIMQYKDQDESTYIKFTICKIFKNEIRSIEKVYPNNYVVLGFLFVFFSRHFLYGFNFTPLLLVPTVQPVVSSLKKIRCAWQTGYPFGPLTRTQTAPRKPDCWSWSSWCFPLDQDEDRWEYWPPILACCPEWWKSQNSWWHH